MIKFIAKLAIAGLMLWYVFEALSGQEILGYMQSANPVYLGLAFLSIIAATYLSSLRLGIYLGMNRKIATPLYYSGMLFNTMLPGGISGDGYIAYSLKKKHGIGIKRGAQILLLNRANGLFFLNLLFFGFLLASEYARFHYVELAVIGLFLLQMPVYFFISRKFLGESWGLFLKTAVYSLALQICSVMAGIFIFLAIGVKNNLIEYICQFIGAAIASIIPITPGGVGIRELVFYKGSKLIGIDAEFGVASSLVYFGLYLLVSVTGAYFILREKKKNGGA